MNPRAYTFFLDKTIVQPIKRVLIDVWSRIAYHDAQLLRQNRQRQTLNAYLYAAMDEREQQNEFTYPHYAHR